MYIGLCGCFKAVPAFELAISQAIFHSKDLSEENLLCSFVSM
jgi:hypothetical protein